MNEAPWRVMVSYAIFKGAVVATFTAVVGTLFWQSIAVAIVSGSLGMIGMIGAAWITTRATDRRVAKINTNLEDMKGQLGASKRRTDLIDDRDKDHPPTERGGS